MGLFERESNVVYHSTKRVKAKTIISEGFRPEIGNSSTSQMISSAVEKSDTSFSLPFEREDVSYFHINPELPKERLEDAIFEDESVVIVVDGKELCSKYECYIADMDILNEIIDRIVGGPVGKYDSIESAVSGYENSVTSVTSYNEVVSVSSEFGYPELLVVGHIEPTCIVEVFE